MNDKNSQPIQAQEVAKVLRKAINGLLRGMNELTRIASGRKKRRRKVGPTHRDILQANRLLLAIFEQFWRLAFSQHADIAKEAMELAEEALKMVEAEAWRAENRQRLRELKDASGM